MDRPIDWACIANRSPTTINALPDNVFVEIFSLCRMDEVANIAKSHRPWKWQRLAHVCRTWRHIMFASSRRLRLELLCTYGTPVKNNMGGLPAFPIVVSFLGRRLRRCDQDNILPALLEHRDRVRVVEIDMPGSLLEELVTAMQEPFPALTHVQLGSKRYITSALSDSFLGGSAPRLQSIHTFDIPFPAAPTLLASAHDLVDVELSRIPRTGYIPPDTMVASLTALPRLKYLTFGFDDSISYPNRLHPPPTTRNIFPALIRFNFRGLFKYFEDFVAQVDAPQLDNLWIEYQEQEIPDIQIPQLCKFLNRSENFKLPWSIRADIFLNPADAVAIRLDNSRSSFYLSVQQEAIGQVLNHHFSVMLSNVDRLFINAYFDDTCLEVPWLALFRPFTSVKALCVWEAVSWDVHLALNDVTGDGVAEVLPALELLCFKKVVSAGFIGKFSWGFVTARQNVGRPVTVVDEHRFNERLEMLDASE